MLRTCILALCAILFSHAYGCAYQFQGARNPLRELGVRKIYVSEFRNLTYRPGIEHLFTTAMIREIGRADAFQIVNSQKDADAILSGVVTTAESTPGSTKIFRVITREVNGVPEYRDINVAAEYSAGVGCSVELRDQSNRIIFTQNVSGTKIHPGAAQRGDAGTTAPLINDSEQRLAIQFLASQMMGSVYQRMIDTF